jgi:hypothetical protein
MIYRILNRASAFQLDQNAFHFLEATQDIGIYDYHYRKVENTNLILNYLNQLRFSAYGSIYHRRRVVGILMKSTPRLKLSDKTT